MVDHPKPLVAVYPGTFDPMTLGHEDLMRRASRLFDKLILAIAAGHHKRTMFTIASKVASRSRRSTSAERQPTRLVNPCASRCRQTAEPTSP